MGPVWRHAALWGIDHYLIMYAWDIWADNIHLWQEPLKRYNIAGVITTSSDAASLLASALPTIPIRVVLEAATISEFGGSRPLVDRSISVLEMGRRHEGLHLALRKGLPRATHRFQEASRPIFPSRADLLRALEDAVISVCIPRSITHPDQAGPVCSVTHRYFESMAAGAIVLGTAPPELVELFGYDPVVGVDWRDPARQVRSILADRARYQPLVDRNLATVREKGDWTARRHEISAAVAEFREAL